MGLFLRLLTPGRTPIVQTLEDLLSPSYDEERQGSGVVPGLVLPRVLIHNLRTD